MLEKLKYPLIILFVFSLFRVSIVFCQPLETSTARLKERGELELNAKFDYITSKDIKEKSLALGLLYGLSSRLQLEVVPTIYTSVYTTLEPFAQGFGDIEVSLFYLLLKEHRNFPAIALQGEVKLPTAKDTLLGTQRFDYSAFIIASKKFQKLDTHLNFGYTIIGQAEDTKLNNIFSLSVAGEYELSEKFELVAEILANSSSFVNETDDERISHPSLVPGELAGLLGGRYHLNENLEFAIGFNYNNHKELLIRSGIIYCF